MALNFPNNPNTGDTYLNYTWDGAKWTLLNEADAFEIFVAADDSTKVLINSGESVKFIGAGGITTSADSEGNITINAPVNITGNAATVTNGVYTSESYEDPSWLTSFNYLKLINSPQIPTNTNQLVNGAGFITSTSSLVNGVSSLSLASDGTLTFPDDTEQTTAWTGVADANLLSGSTLASGVTSSSLTSVGTLTGLTTSGAVSVTYTPGSTTGSSLTLTGKDTQGGTGYFDFLKTTNTTSGASNPNKSFRLTSTGSIEIINSAYTANIFSLTDTGGLSVPGPISIGGKKAVNGPAFRAYVDTGQTITSGSQQKVIFGTENFDTDNCFATSRFTPTIEGYYQFNATVRISGGTSTGEYMIVLYKNGSEYARGHNGSGTEIGASFYSLQISDVAYANGTGDFFEIYFQQTSTANKTTTAGSPISYFSGCMIRGA